MADDYDRFTPVRDEARLEQFRAAGGRRVPVHLDGAEMKRAAAGQPVVARVPGVHEGLRYVAQGGSLADPRSACVYVAEPGLKYIGPTCADLEQPETD